MRKINEDELELDIPETEENSELDLDIDDGSSDIQTVYEDDKFKVLNPTSEWGLLASSTGTDWDLEERSWILDKYNLQYIIVEKTGKKRKFRVQKGYSDIYAPSGARYSAGTWLGKNGTVGLQRWFLSGKWPYINAQLQKKVGANILTSDNNNNTYEYPSEFDGGWSVRRNATKITKIKIKPGTESIKDLSGFPSVKKLVIPEGVKRINRYACSFLSSLEELYLPNTLTKIGEGAFKGAKLKSVFIPKSVKTMGRSVFECDKWYGEYKHNILDPESLTIYCEASEQPSGWDENWNDCQYLGWDRATGKSINSKYPVIWGATRPTTVTEDLDNDDFDVLEVDTELQPYYLGDEEKCIELIEAHKNEKCWFLSLSDGVWDCYSGLDELSNDDILGGLKTFEEAKRIFLEYDFSEGFNYAKEEAEEAGEPLYYESDIYIECILDLTYDEDNEMDYSDSKAVAVREFIYDEESPENNVSEDLENTDFEVENTDLGGYKLSEDNLQDISYLRDKYLGEFVQYTDSYNNQRYEDLNLLWFEYPHDNDDGQWYLFKVKDNDDFLHDYNIRYPYIVVYQGFGDYGPENLREKTRTGQGVGRIGEYIVSKLNLEGTIPEIDLLNNHTINEDLDLDTNDNLDL